MKKTILTVLVGIGASALLSGCPLPELPGLPGLFSTRIDAPTQPGDMRPAESGARPVDNKWAAKQGSA